MRNDRIFNRAVFVAAIITMFNVVMMRGFTSQVSTIVLLTAVMAVGCVYAFASAFLAEAILKRVRANEFVGLFASATLVVAAVSLGGLVTTHVPISAELVGYLVIGASTEAGIAVALIAIIEKAARWVATTDLF